MTTKTTGKVYRKLAVRAGVYRQMSVDPYTDQMVTETVYISPQYLKQSAWSTMQMMRRGIDVPVCLDHQESAVPRKSVDKWSEDEMRSSVGLLQSVSYNPETESHEYVFEIKDPAIAEKIDNGTIKRVSPNFLSQIGSGDGGNWQNIVGHLALTFRPKDYRQSADKMETVAYSGRTGQKRFSTLSPVKNSGILIVPMHKLEMGVLKTMVRKRGNEWRFSSTDYTFRFSSKDAFENWLKHHYSKTLRMSVNRKPFATLYFAVVHAPVGGININGRMYKGGQFIPAANLEGIPAADRQKIQEASAKRLENRNQSAAKWKNDGEDWHQAIARHAGEHGSRPMDEDDERAASRRLNSLKAHHGENVHQRIAELAGIESKQLAQLPPGDPKADHIKRRLRAYAKMSEALKASGGVSVPEFNPQPPATVAPELVKPEVKAKPANWRDAIKGQPRWQAVDTIRQQNINDLTFDEYENVKKWDNEETGSNDKSFEGRIPMRLNRGKDSFRVAHDRNMSDQYSDHLRQQYEDAKEKAFLNGEDFAGGKPEWAMSLREYESATGNSDYEYKELMNRALSQGKVDERGNVVGKKGDAAPAEGNESHANALADMAGAADDVDFAVKSRLHKEMKTELLSRMHDDYRHLTEEQKAAVDKEIGALPHTALGERDENGNFDDTGRFTSDEAGKIIDKVNDMAIEVKDVNERKERDEKKKSQHAKDVEEAAKRGMVFERPDNHDNPGELKVHPEQLDKAKAAIQEYRDKAKQNLIDSKNQLNKKEVARSKRLHKQYSEVADDMQDQVWKHEKDKAPLEVTPSMVKPSNKPLPKPGDDSSKSGAELATKLANDEVLMPLPKQADPEKRAGDPVKKALGFDASSIADIHAKLVAQNPTNAYSESHNKAAAAAMINSHIGSFIREADQKIKNGTITDEEAAAYDAIQQDKHFGDLREKLSDLGGAGWQQANDDRIPAKIDPIHMADPKDRYQAEIKQNGIESDIGRYSHHAMNHDDLKMKLAKLDDATEVRRREREKLRDLSYKAAKNGRGDLVKKYDAKLEEFDNAAQKSQDERLELIDKINHHRTNMAKSNPNLPEFVKYAHVKTKDYTGAPNEGVYQAIKDESIAHARTLGHDAEVGDMVAKELSKGFRIADSDEFKRVVDRSANMVANDRQRKAELEDIQNLPGYADAPDHIKETIRLNHENGKYGSSLKRMAEGMISDHQAKTGAEKKMAEEKIQGEKRKAEVAKIVGDIAAGKQVDADPKTMREAVHQAMKQQGDFRPSKGDSHKVFPKSHYTKDTPVGSYNFQRLVKEKGYWTDGKALVKVPDDVRAKSKGGEGQMPNVDVILEDAANAKGKAKIVGEATPDDINSFHKYLLQDDLGNQAQVDKNAHAAVMSLHPDAVPHLSHGKGEGKFGTVSYKDSNGNVVGVVVPLTAKGDDSKATVGNDIKSYKEFAEPGPYSPDQMEEIGDTIAHPDMKTKVRIMGVGNSKNKHYTVQGYHGTYATESQAKKAAREILSYAHGTDEGDETGDHIFKPKGQKTKADEGVQKKIDFHKALDTHVKSRKYSKKKVMETGEVPDGKYSSKPGEYETTEHDYEGSPFKIVSRPYTKDRGKISKQQTHSVVHKKSGAKLGGWHSLDDAKKHAALAESAHHWDFDTPDYFADKGDEAKKIQASLKKIEDTIENSSYDPEVNLPASSKKFSVTHAPAGGTGCIASMQASSLFLGRDSMKAASMYGK